MFYLLKLVIPCLIFVSSFSSCAYQKSDEELIEAQIGNFVTAYNSGDMNAVLDCMDAKSRNTYKAAMEISDSLIGNIKGIGGISVSDLFGLGVGTANEGDVLTVAIQEINIENDVSATVDVTMTYKDKFHEFTDEAFFTMQKENDNWFVKNFEEKK